MDDRSYFTNKLFRKTRTITTPTQEEELRSFRSTEKGEEDPIDSQIWVIKPIIGHYLTETSKHKNRSRAIINGSTRNLRVN